MNRHPKKTAFSPESSRGRCAGVTRCHHVCVEPKPHLPCQLVEASATVIDAMRFLSVAERELRAGARQKATHRLRWITGAVFFALLAWLMWVFNGFRAPQIFSAFSAITLFYCLLIGTARTADCLSSEKREGTMGLLFLTNLNGSEIIGGKLCSSAVAAAYG